MNFKLDIGPAREFALDIWGDLKETGLAAVSVALAVTFVAVSAIVLRPGAPPEVRTGYPAADAAPTQDVALALPSDAPPKLADIDLAAPRDPFQTLDKLDSGDDAKPAESVENMTVAPETESSGGSGVSSDDASTVSYDDSDQLVPMDDLETAEGGEQASEVEAQIEQDSDPKAPQVSDYSYAADVQFGIEGSLKRYRDVQRLEFVPSRSNPLLMYLGVKADHETLVFMVDSRLSQGGEGKCVPKPSLCTFIEVSEDPGRDEHRFRDGDGEEYLLRVRGVVRTTASNSTHDAGLSDTPVLVDGSR